MVKIPIYSKKLKVIQGAGGQEYTKAKKPMVRHEETHVQRPIVRLLAQIEGYTRQLTFAHIPNQLLRRRDLRKIFHGLGVRSGVPDLIIPIGGGRTIWCELKYDGQPVSADQSEYMDKLRALGHIVEIIDAKDSQDAQNQMIALLAKYGIADFRLKVPECPVS